MIWCPHKPQGYTWVTPVTDEQSLLQGGWWPKWQGLALMTVCVILPTL